MMPAVFFRPVCVRRRNGDGVRIQAGEFGQNAIAAVSQLDDKRFKRSPALPDRVRIGRRLVCPNAIN